MNRQQLIAIAATKGIELGGTFGGFLGQYVQATLEAMMDTRSEAENLHAQITSEYEPSDLKAETIQALNDVIATYPGGG